MGKTGWIEEDLWAKIRRVVPILTVDIIAVYMNRVLVMLRNNAPARDTWFTPGGRVYFGERLEDAVRRNLREETRLNPVIVEEKGVMEHIYPKAHCVTVYYRADVADDKVRMNDEHREYRWVSRVDDNIHPYAREMILRSKVFA